MKGDPRAGACRRKATNEERSQETPMRIALFIASMSALLVAAAAEKDSTETLAAQVRAAETAFAKSMADRDIKAFASHVAEDAVFFGGKNVSHGKEAVVAGWKPLFEGSKAPFSWAPAQVEVLASGTLAHSSGPVRDAEGKHMGNFNSIWRRDPDGTWKVVFDKGCDVCDCAPKQ
jgi:ketosteroid isomerase-like protein